MKIINEKGIVNIYLAIIVLISVLAAGGGTYYFKNDEIKKKKSEKDKEVQALQEKIKDITAKVKVEDVKVEKLKNCDFEPPLAWKRPGLMTEAEMADIRTKVAEPYFDYHNENGLKVVSMVVERYAIGEEPSGYKYGADAVEKDAVIASWLFGNTPTLGYWYPDCLGACTFSDTFRAEHPESVAAYNAANGL